MYSPSYSRLSQSANKNLRTYASNSMSSSFYSPPTQRGYSPSTVKGRNQTFNWSTYQASFLDETAQHSILSYGSSLPVLITEAITERISDVSVKLEDCGWASLVCGRRLFIWKYRSDTEARNAFTHCWELTLPPSELAHKAELVHVSLSRESQMPSALAVSPEGIVRYWPNIIHEGLSAEASTDMSGQECYLLTSVHSLGCIVATTTCSLVLITPTSSDGQYNVICRTLKFPQSVLAGIGRKVSSFIFGGMPSHASENKQLIRVLSAEGSHSGECFLFVLSNTSLQKWRLAEDEPDELVAETDLSRSLKERYIKSVWSANEAGQLHQMKTWCLDMQLFQGGILILTAAMNPGNSPVLYYGFAFFDLTVGETFGTSTFQLLKHYEKYQMESEEKLMSLRFIISSKNTVLAYVYNSDKVFCLSMTDNNGSENDIIDVSTFGSILGAGTYDGEPLFFTQYQGLLSLQHNQNNYLNASMQMSTVPKEVVREQPIGETDNSYTSKLRSAMCLYYNHKIDDCQDIINEVFPIPSVAKYTPELDSAVISLSTQIIDDYPISDPRWCESVPSGESVSSSLIILHQLEDKLKAHDYLINFLKALGLFDRLTTVKIDGGPVATKVRLCEHAEKVTMAKTIRRFVIEYGEMLDNIIKETLISRKVELKNHLTYQDMYFREVSEIQSIFPKLVEWEERLLLDENQDIISLISMVNSIFVGVMGSALQYHNSKETIYDLPDSETGLPYQPWVASDAPSGMRTLLFKQLSINMQYMLKVTDDIQIQGSIFQHYVDLVDFLLDGFVSQLESLRGTEQHSVLEQRYHREMNRLIEPLLKVEQFERAASLAEKYFDFDILVQICEISGNQERLQRYILQFKDQGFSDFMFTWYLEKGMRNKILQQPMGQQNELSRFLQNHDDLSWIHYLSHSQYALSQQTLKELAFKETRYLNKKRTLLSLSKLALIVSELPSDVKNDNLDVLNLEQDLIAHQENLPDSVVEAFGLDPDTMRVLSPEELIEMYICEENTSANAFDFKIALELLQFLKKPPGDEDYESLRMHIWCKAVLRNNWDELDKDKPYESIKDTIFYQLIELACDRGVDLHNFVIPVDTLLQCSELDSLSENPNFVFLLRAGYEYIYKLVE